LTEVELTAVVNRSDEKIALIFSHQRAESIDSTKHDLAIWHSSLIS